MNAKGVRGRLLCILLLLFLLPGCGNSGGDLALTPVVSLTNSDISWRGTFVGLVPRYSAEIESLIRNQNPQIMRHLYSFLEDEDSYVAAHVILTLRSSKHYKFSATEWNGLRVNILADGSVIIANQQQAIRQQWQSERRTGK